MGLSRRSMYTINRRRRDWPLPSLEEIEEEERALLQTSKELPPSLKEIIEFHILGGEEENTLVALKPN